MGSIVPSTDNQLLGVYTAPGSVPTTATPGVTQVGQVSITAVATQTTTTTTTSPTVTSNTAIVTVGAGSGLTVTPTSVTVPAGGIHQFSALLNGLTDTMRLGQLRRQPTQRFMARSIPAASTPRL